MEVALRLVSHRDPTFLQQIPVNVRAGDVLSLAKLIRTNLPKRLELLLR